MPIPDDLREPYEATIAVYLECDLGRHRLPRALYDLVLDEIERLPRVELERVAIIVHSHGMPFNSRDHGSTTGSKSDVPDSEASRYELHHFVTAYLMLYLEADQAIITEQARREAWRPSGGLEKPSRETVAWERQGRARTTRAISATL
jgi:hypothetical protein